MINNNKILTVSYGTFSCTLEGFDDSFGTMKAIAEYFRDLAADDRYFGAEPPQPDAEMLARIAQKEVSRRVEAREQDGKIVLSALENGAAAAPVAALAATAPTAETEIAPQIEAQVAQPVQDAPVEEAVVETVEETAMVPETETAEIATSPVTAEMEMAEAEAVVIETPEPVEAVAEETPTQAEVPDAPEVTTEEPEAQEDLSVEPEIEANAQGEDETSIEAEFVEDENDIVPGQPDAEVSAFFEEANAEAAAPAAPVVEAAPQSEEAAPDSIAAKLQRIRAVVAQQEEASEEDDYLEDEHANGAEETTEASTEDTPVAEAIADITTALEEDDAVASIEDLSEDDDVTAILGRIEKAAAEVPAGAQTAEENLYDEVDTVETSVEDSVSNLFDGDADTVEAEAPQAASNPRRVALRKQPAAPAPEAEQAPTAEDTSRRVSRARVIKVKRADLEAAIDQGELEEYNDTEAEASAPAEDAKAPSLDDLAPARRKETALSPEDEEELARELADLEEDISATAAKAPEEEPTALRRGPAPRSVLPEINETDETDVNRLLAETDQQMDEPESATRRDAFAHLRAAVAAKKADVSMGGAADADGGDDAYRNDLAEVVRPRRPEATKARTERPTAAAEPAPLKLVAEQRIDIEGEEARGPVRPRRIAADDAMTSPEDGDSFSEFADEMGAVTLPQLLEAAAAYMSFVEGREQFSRPQLMTKVRQAGGNEDFSREEGLRSFGQLLRAGKIEKIKGGRFTVSDDIGYRPDERAAG